MSPPPSLPPPPPSHPHPGTPPLLSSSPLPSLGIHSDSNSPGVLGLNKCLLSNMYHFILKIVPISKQLLESCSRSSSFTWHCKIYDRTSFTTEFHSYQHQQMSSLKNENCKKHPGYLTLWMFMYSCSLIKAQMECKLNVLFGSFACIFFDSKCQSVVQMSTDQHPSLVTFHQPCEMKPTTAKPYSLYCDINRFIMYIH